MIRQHARRWASRSVTETSLRPIHRRAIRNFTSSSRCLSDVSSAAKSSVVSGATSSGTKIRSVPFHFTPEDAEARTRMAALLASATLPNMIAAIIYRYFPTSIQSLLQPLLIELGLSGHSIKLQQVRPVLWPTWRFMGVWEGPVEGEILKMDVNELRKSGERGEAVYREDEDGSKIMSKERVKGTGFLSVTEGGFPGNSFSPLSLLSFSNHQLPTDIPIYDPSLDLAQLGTDAQGENVVKAVPFTIPPVEVVELAKREIIRNGKRGREGRVGWMGMEFDLRKGWKEEMLAFYPIYMPIYIAEYTHTTESDTQGPLGYENESPDDDFRAQNSAGRSGRGNGQLPRGKTQTLTIVMDAHMENADECRIAVPRPWSSMRADEPKSYYMCEPSFLTDLSVLLNPPKLGMAAVFSESNSNSLRTGKPSVSEAVQAMSLAFGASGGPGLASKISSGFGAWLCPPAEADVWDEAQPRGGRYVPRKSPLVTVDQGTDLTDEQWRDTRIMHWDEDQRIRNGEWAVASMDKMASKVVLDGMGNVPDDPNTTVRVVELNGKLSLPTWKDLSPAELREDAMKGHREATMVWEETMPEWVKKRRQAESELKVKSIQPSSAGERDRPSSNEPYQVKFSGPATALFESHIVSGAGSSNARPGLRQRRGASNAHPLDQPWSRRYISTRDLPASSASPVQTFSDASVDSVTASAKRAEVPSRLGATTQDSRSGTHLSTETSSDASADAVTTRAQHAALPESSLSLGQPEHLQPGLELPSAFGRNQSLAVSDDSRKMLEKIVGNFSAVRWAVAYGSGIFEQDGYAKEKKLPMLDFVFGTSHASHFHAVNLDRHPSHYPLLARWLGVDYITRIQNAGAGVWYATMIDMEGRKIKYGVISIDSLCEDLMDWKTLYIGGRMMKPVRLVKKDQRVVLANQVNLVSALRVALLSLPEEFTERELWEKIAGISYAGDPRMSMGGENPNKVANIVVPQIHRFRELYFKLLAADGGVKAKDPQAAEARRTVGGTRADEKDEAVWRSMGMGEPGGKGIMVQTNDPEHRANLLKRLPRTLKSALQARYTAKLKVTVVRPSDAEEARGKMASGEDGHISEADFWLKVGAEEDVRKTIDQELRNIVRGPAVAQTFKGIFTAGFRKSITYAGRKVAKWWKGQPAGSTK